MVVRWNLFSLLCSSLKAPIVASSDARNIKLSIRQEGDQIVVNGHKWYENYIAGWRQRADDEACRWISGAGDPRCRLHLVMGQSDPNNKNEYLRQSIVIVPADAPGVKIIRPMQVFGYDDAPEGHCEIIYENVRVPASNLIAGWGRGFEVRRFHQCHLVDANATIGHPRTSWVCSLSVI